MATSSPMHTHPCPACNKRTRADGYCRTVGCPNQVPDALIAPAREAALAEMREIIRAARRHRTTRAEREHPMNLIPEADSPEDVTA